MLFTCFIIFLVQHMPIKNSSANHYFNSFRKIQNGGHGLHNSHYTIKASKVGKIQ